MDSGSGSMQSSSGGEDQEYDSQPVFLNNIMNPHTASFSSFLPNNYNSHQSNTIFDLPASNYNLQPFSQPQPNISNPNIKNPLINLSMLNSGSTLRSELPNSSMAVTSNDEFLLHPADQAGQNQGYFPGPSSTQVQQRNISSEQPARNSKKRTRASRRAPTTVLTTDTSNFRAMVQEFTGIPAPPFSAGSSYSRRLDLFGSAGSSLRSGQMEPVGGGGLYPLRPNSSQKVQPFLSNYSTSNSNTPNSLLNNNNVANSSNYANPILDRLGFTTKDQSSQNMVNIQFQQHDHFGSKSQVNDRHLGMSSFDQELGANRGTHVNANLSSGARSINVEREDHEANYLRSLEGNFESSSSRVVNSTCKLNFTGSRSDFHDHHREKDLMDQNNVVSTSRGEGTVESWICSSD